MLIAVAVIVAVAASGAVTSRLSPDRADFREAIVVAHGTLSLNPLLADGDPAATDVGTLLYPALLRLDRLARPVADLAASWGVSGDGLSYRVALPAVRRWSDGTPLNADDVLATVALVQGAGFPDTVLAASWRGVRADVAGDAVTFTLTGARSSFPVALAELPILPARSIRNRTVAALEAVASVPMPADGLYQVAEVTSTVVRLSANLRSPVTPALATVELRLTASFDAAVQLLGQGQVDGVVAVTPDQRLKVSRIDRVHLHDITTFEFADLLFNERAAGLGDTAVRKAVASAVDRHALISGPLHGSAVLQMGAMPAGVLWVQAAGQPPEDPSPVLAARALDAAGWVAGPDGVRQKAGMRLQFTLSVPATPPLAAVAGVLAQQLRGLGISCQIEPVSTEHFAERVITPMTFQLALVDWQTAGDPDVSSFWRSNAAPPQGLNASGAPTDPFLDQALDSLATLSDAALRQSAAVRVDSRLADGAPAVFLYAPTVTFATDDDFASIDVPPTGGRAARHADMATWAQRPH